MPGIRDHDLWLEDPFQDDQDESEPEERDDFPDYPDQLEAPM